MLIGKGSPDPFPPWIIWYKFIDRSYVRSAAVDSTGRELNRNRLIALMSAIVLEEVILTTRSSLCFHLLSFGECNLIFFSLLHLASRNYYSDGQCDFWWVDNFYWEETWYGSIENVFVFHWTISKYACACILVQGESIVGLKGATRMLLMKLSDW